MKMCRLFGRYGISITCRTGMIEKLRVKIWNYSEAQESNFRAHTKPPGRIEKTRFVNQNTSDDGKAMEEGAACNGRKHPSIGTKRH